MVGNVNLFFQNKREDPDFEVQCETMARRAKEISMTRAGMTITDSIALFAKLGFGIVGTVLIFGQIEICGRCSCKLVSEKAKGSNST
ncbi:hypothetical protein BGW80DRAFT_1346795 [Lactifluus volemus]|nr:hypothetical protein BGW80DRAFT_1346795 [Lactifluus volemus]